MEECYWEGKDYGIGDGPTYISRSCRKQLFADSASVFSFEKNGKKFEIVGKENILAIRIQVLESGDSEVYYIAGENTQIQAIEYVLVDQKEEEISVKNIQSDSILVFSLDQRGNVTPKKITDLNPE